MQKFDIVIVGSGLGGLLSAVILSKEGFRVAVIEQNKQIGGCLQTFAFDKKVFDSCVHYIGALDDGQTQNRIFDYVGIMDDLELEKLDADGFDQVAFGDENILYPHAQGATHFTQSLLPYFKHAKADLVQYATTLKEVAASFPLYNLRNGDAGEKEKVMHWSMEQAMAHVKDEKLRHVLMGNNLLYAGSATKTPFYVHGLVNKSYIDSAYRCMGGSSRIAKLLWKKLQENGGVIFRNEKVVQLVEEAGLISKAVTEQENEYYGDRFIANVHPAMVLQWIECSQIKKIYRKRITSAENSISAFMLNIVLKPGKVAYRNHNIYWNRSENSYAALNYKPEDWPANYALYFGEDPLCPGKADTVAILTYMHAAETEIWMHTHNRSAQPSDREQSYLEFKEQKAALLLKKVAERYPELKEHIQSYGIATPLTFRDYMGSPDGSMYGIMSDVTQEAQTRIPVRTKIPNLFLTGQNVGLHGVLGVSINAVAVCGELLGLDFLLNKINKKQQS